MTRNGTTVSPVIGRKGLIYLHKSPEDSLLHFCWKDRVTGRVEDDFIIFPDEVEFKRVTQCQTGRVFVLKFKTSGLRLFYWSQEPKEDKDEQWVNSFNVFMNSQPIPNILGSPTGCLPIFTSPSNYSGVVRDLEQEGLTPVLSQVSGAQHLNLNTLFSLYENQSLNDRPIRSVTEQMLVPAPELTDSDSDSDWEDFNEFDTMPALEYPDELPIESAILETQANSLPDLMDCLTVPKDNDLNVALSSALTIDLLQPILCDKNFLSKICIFLPITDYIAQNETERYESTVQELAETIESPQFKEAVTEFASALQSGNLGLFMSQYRFGPNCMNAVESGDLIGFLEELQKRLFKGNTQ